MSGAAVVGLVALDDATRTSSVGRRALVAFIARASPDPGRTLSSGKFNVTKLFSTAAQTDAPADRTSASFRVWTVIEGDVLVVYVAGELRLDGRHLVTHACLQQGRLIVRVDMADLTLLTLTASVGCWRPAGCSNDVGGR